MDTEGVNDSAQPSSSPIAADERNTDTEIDENILDMPPPWSPKIFLSPNAYPSRFPNGIPPFFQ